MPNWDLAFSKANTQRRRRRLGGPGFIPTLEGDPEGFNKLDPQSLFSGAESQRYLAQNQESARNVLARAQIAGVPLEGSREMAQLHEMERKGFVESGLSFLGGVIRFITGPFETANLAVQDLTSSKVHDINFGDYLDAFFGGIEDRPDELELFTERTGANPQRGGKTLDLWGWEATDNWFNKAAHGVAGFGLEVITDPLTYLTFGYSALGKAVVSKRLFQYSDEAIDAMRGAGRMENAFSRYAGQHIDDITKKLDDAWETLPDWQASTTSSPTEPQATAFGTMVASPTTVTTIDV